MLVHLGVDVIEHLVMFPLYLCCVYVLYYMLSIGGPMTFDN